ncbi:hypothetical protein TRFO_07193 [Tritrichomonas foetus]|uniref:Uncharacterized protein n=1 Tax=Tritrichomonas foetus TaxID=1144522 RepID=A0A1J4JT98_9EUKA|nr:hypothetical protein TRFO_07193 [Tritrichomonas foetus]|eukprot:OHT02343.1 hypothetical protein TRFO_07193 [Tritrichomonas foetus]
MDEISTTKPSIIVKNIIETILTIIVLIFCARCLKFIQTDSQIIMNNPRLIKKFTISKSNDIDVYLLIITASQNKKRTDYALNNWIPEFVNKYNKSEIVFVSDEPVENNFSLKTLILFKNYTTKVAIEQGEIQYGNKFKDTEKTIKFYHGMKDFYENTKYRWFKYQDDDGAIYVPNFGVMMKDFNQQFNPNEEMVVKGACTMHTSVVYDGEEDLYIQGGTGLVMSRKSIEFFLKHFDEWFRDLHIYEDRHLMRMFEKMGISGVNISSTYFIGDPFKEPNMDIIIRNKMFEYIQECPKVHPPTQCKPEFYEFRKIASYHKYWYLDFLDEYLRNNILPKGLRFYDNHCDPQVCLMKETNVSEQ